MTNFRPGDLLLVTFPFTRGDRGKQRPALVLIDTGDADLIVARVTTQLYDTSLDVQISEWKAAGLLAPSVVRLHKLATIEKNLVSRQIGALTKYDRDRIGKVVAQLCNGWCAL